ncbi:sensor histidine kinase [Kitasatospora sp. NBC_01287]|uniref:sensor histidine kinase n=1 Tax=Kitasatospora sp. NBC_01287 TaxID=2903573 RepID=UPI002250894B|nr:sensor histidine kinase [Kitasatospora sp. NBC_01287]MCX4745773.1 sensor histidine kinase [Kitasatospora sp. NBC_01287]
MSAALSAPQRVRRAVRDRPWSAAARRHTVFVVAGLPVHAAGTFAPLAPLLLGLVLVPLAVSLTAMLILTVVFGALYALLLTNCFLLLTRLQSSRLAALLDIRLPAPPRRPLAEALRSDVLWRQAAYHVLVGPFLAAGALLTLAAWTGGALLLALPCVAWALPASSPLSPSTRPIAVAAAWLLGALLLFAAPALAGAVTRADVAAARALLGPGRTEELQRRVDHLAVSRVALLAAADTERRRIERDLHDGAQQRLVALAMKLGIARATRSDLTPEVRQLLTEVHAEAKEALTELRDLVRGLHPAVLDEQGLDAALSGIAARAPFPVRLHVTAQGRAVPAVEAVAYFVVSEALANIAKHARASQADIHLAREADTLRVTVIDDGVGGADAARGTGLTGLTQRVASVDGTLSISSPVGGPTTITVELPCEL